MLIKVKVKQKISQNFAMNFLLIVFILHFLRHWLAKKSKLISSQRTKSIVSRNVWKRRKESHHSNSVWFSQESKCKMSHYLLWLNSLSYWIFRNDDKTAQDYKVQGGSVLHLVLALRGGINWILLKNGVDNLLSAFYFHLTFIWLSIKIWKNEFGFVFLNFYRKWSSPVWD